MIDVFRGVFEILTAGAILTLESTHTIRLHYVCIPTLEFRRSFAFACGELYRIARIGNLRSWHGFFRKSRSLVDAFVMLEFFQPVAYFNGASVYLPFVYFPKLSIRIEQAFRQVHGTTPLGTPLLFDPS